MTATTAQDWEDRSAALWSRIDALAPEDFLARTDALAAELGADHPVALFERAAARDSLGRADEAVPLYRRALRGELPGERRRRAVIQLASSRRALGDPEESISLLTAERAHGEDHLSDALTAVLALALADAGRAREGVAEAVAALAPHLPRYQRSMANYARMMGEAEAQKNQPLRRLRSGVRDGVPEGEPASRDGPAERQPLLQPPGTGIGSPPWHLPSRPTPPWTWPGCSTSYAPGTTRSSSLAAPTAPRRARR
ncbi:tetratricopeptide repeat protein [Streptomyces sp. SID4945]|uniref:tetratricopeptide repeat protein n=1 Tax=unclassified Streptomyces TaxID=2593676 RepID=UPI0031BB9267